MNTDVCKLGTWGCPDPKNYELSYFKKLQLDFYSDSRVESCPNPASGDGIMVSYVLQRPKTEILHEGLNFTDEDIDQDIHGNKTSEGVISSVFHPGVLERFCRIIGETVENTTKDDRICSYVISSPISLYGEVHYTITKDADYFVYSLPAKENFQSWLKQEYGEEISALSTAWGQDFTDWSNIEMPDGPKCENCGIDTRKCWSDFIHWYNGWIMEVTRRCLSIVRSKTGKPAILMLGGPKIGIAQGVCCGNVGPVVKLLGSLKPGILSDTDSQTLFSAKYTRAACSQYGVGLMLEHIGPPYLEVFHQYNTILNVLATSADRVHLAHQGELYNPEHWFHKVWASLSQFVHRYKTSYVKSDSAVFHSYITSWFRPDQSNADALKCYDSTNMLWFPDRGYPSLGRVLGSPDVLDDVMIEDGVLDGLKLLLIPNSSVTLTTRKAFDAIRKWVREGGMLVGFGTGCLAYIVETDRTVVRALLEVDELTPGALPEHRWESIGNGLETVEYAMGKGKVVLYRSVENPEGLEINNVYGVIERFAEKVREASVTVWCRTNRGYDANILYCGLDSLSGKHIFAGDFTRYIRAGLSGPIFWEDCSFQLTFDVSLAGDAELIIVSDSFESCVGGTAEIDRDNHINIVQFALPGTLELKFGKGRRGITLDQADLGASFPTYLP